MVNHKRPTPGERMEACYPQSKDFQRMFGRPLGEFLNCGFDVIKFDDEVVKAVDGVSTLEALREKFGEEGVQVVQQIMEFESKNPNLVVIGAFQQARADKKA